MKKINRYINHDLKLRVHWLRANRISLNVDKTEMIIFQPKEKDITKKLNFRIAGQQIYISKQLNYLGLMLDESLTWSPQAKESKCSPGKIKTLYVK